MPTQRSRRALDALAFLAPDVQTGVGPFLVVFMSTALHWNAGRVGTVMFTSAIVGLLIQTPVGAFVDRVQSKPRWIAIALGIIACSVLMMGILPSYGVILSGQTAIGVAGAVISPAIASVSLGLVGRKKMPLRLGRNTALTAAGTVIWAICTGIIGRVFGPQAMFIYAVAMGIPAITAALLIRNDDVDAVAARGADRKDSGENGRWYDHRLILLCACALLFHLANAAMLTSVAQVIAAQVGDRATLYMSACLVVTQLVSMGAGIVAGYYARRLPRKPIFIVAFISLLIRGLFYLVFRDPITLVALQILDGVASGIFGVMLILMIGDLTQGSGLFNLGQGIALTAAGAGAALSNLVAGLVSDFAGYSASFLMLTIIAGVALLLFATAMPETQKQKKREKKRMAARGI